MSCSAWLRQLFFQLVKETLEQTQLEDVSDHINTLAMELLDVSSLFSNAVEMATNAKGFLEDFNTLSLLFLAAADVGSVDNRIDAETGSSIHKAKEIQDAVTALSSRLDFHELNQAFNECALGQEVLARLAEMLSREGTDEDCTQGVKTAVAAFSSELTTRLVPHAYEPGCLAILQLRLLNEGVLFESV